MTAIRWLQAPELRCGNKVHPLVLFTGSESLTGTCLVLEVAMFSR